MNTKAALQITGVALALSFGVLIFVATQSSGSNEILSQEGEQASGFLGSNLGPQTPTTLTPSAVVGEATESTIATPEPDESTPPVVTADDGRIPVIIDSDANNEVDDQVAISYLLLNSDKFDVKGVTTNDTGRGGPASRHTQEAQYVVDLVGLGDVVPVVQGVEANGKFDNLRGQLDGSFPGVDAVDFIIEEAKKHSPERKLVLMPVGKITNIALAVAKDPSIQPNIKIMAIAGNYTNGGGGCPHGQDCESNLYQGAAGFNFLFDAEVEFEMFPSLPASGRGAASITFVRGEAANRINGLGPTVEAITSPRGTTHTNIGSYLATLFGGSGSKPIYDTAPIAILINPSFGDKITIPAPSYNPNGRSWTERPGNERQISYWDNLESGSIRQDIYRSFDSPVVND